MTGSFRQIEQYMLDHMPSSDPVHGPEHIYRVVTTALEIAAHCEQTFHPAVLLAACFLHDIGRIDQERYPKSSHAEIGSQKAYAFLLAIGWEKEKAQLAANAILTHSSQEGVHPAGLEAQILFDADKLDTLGWIGTSRLLMHAGKQGTPLYRLKDGRLHGLQSSFMDDYQAAEAITKNLYTAYGRKMASERLARAKVFYDGLLEDITHYQEQLQNVRTSFFDEADC